MGMERRGLSKESLEVILGFNLFLQLRRVISGQPANDFIDFLLCAAFPLSLVDVGRVNRRKGHGEDAVFCQSSCLKTFCVPGSPHRK
jgi:hypothetical protein